MHNHNNGLKTAGLLGGMFALLLAIGGLLASGTGSSSFIWIFALIGLATTAYGYWNSDKIAIRSMQAYPVTEAEQPAMYKIVRELSADGAAAHAAALRLADGGPERVCHGPQPAECGGVLHRGHPAVAQRTRTARRAGARAHARLQPRHPHLVGGRGGGRRHHLAGPVPALLWWRGPPQRQPDGHDRAWRCWLRWPPP